MGILNSFSIIFPRSYDILKRFVIVVLCYGICFNYPWFIFVIDESKCGKVWKFKSVVGL